MIHSRALRLCVGAFRTTHVEALQVDCGELPLRIRQDKLALAYWARLKGSSEGHPASTATGECWEQGVGKQRAYGWTIGQKVVEYRLGNRETGPAIALGNVPLRLFLKPSVDVDKIEGRREWGEDMRRCVERCR
jgi:hypothetical protein